MLQLGEAHDFPTRDADEQDGRLVMADAGEGDTEGGQDEVDDLSSGTSGDESQDGKTDRSPGWRSKSRQKMEYGKHWILKNLVFVKAGGCLVPLSVIEKAYHLDCQRENQQPLSLSVLARLLHQQFPEAGKCRLGPRGNQKIHYRKLRWQGNDSAKQSSSVTTPLTPAVDNRAEKTPFEGSLSPQMQEDGKEPQPSVSGSGMERKQHMTGAGVSASPNQQSAKDNDEGEKECAEAAARLQQVVKKVFSQGKRDMLLKTFSHSGKCRNTPCTSLCLMFRRVRSHVVGARHACKVLVIYSILLKLHVASCVSDDCGLTACPALRASRQIKRGLDDEQKEGQQEEEHVQLPVTKKLNVKDNQSPCVLLKQPSQAPLPISEPPIPLLPSPPPGTVQPFQFMIVQPMLKQEVCHISKRVYA